MLISTSGKCKGRAQWDVTIHLSTRRVKRSLTIASADKDVDQLLRIAGKTLKGYNHFGK